MSTPLQARYNLGSCTAIPASETSNRVTTGSGFSLTVPVASGSTHSLWTSSDLDFWAPVSGATKVSGSGAITFTAPGQLPGRVFYNVLTETP